MVAKKVQKFKKRIEAKKTEIKRRFGVKEIGIFGSYVRNEQHQGSDLDILVDFQKPIGLFRFMDLEEYLEKLLKTKVDLVSRRALKPRIGEYIIREVQPVW